MHLPNKSIFSVSSFCIYHRHRSTRFFHSVGLLYVKTVLLLSERPSPLDKRRHTSSIPRQGKPLYSPSISNSNTRYIPFVLPKSHALSALILSQTFMFCSFSFSNNLTKKLIEIEMFTLKMVNRSKLTQRYFFSTCFFFS